MATLLTFLREAPRAPHPGRRAESQALAIPGRVRVDPGVVQVRPSRSDPSQARHAGAHARATGHATPPPHAPPAKRRKSGGVDPAS